MRFGTDIGNVVTTHDTDQSATSRRRPFSETVLLAAEMPGAFDSIAEIYDATHGTAILISKCSRPIQISSLEWLRLHRFTERTGMPLIEDETVFFCLHRDGPSGKAPIAARAGLSDFVDDRVQVLADMTSVARKYAFQPKAHEMKRYLPSAQGITVVQSWTEVMSMLRPLF